MIHFRNVSKLYDAYAAVKDVTFSVEKGEMAFLTGPSGAGKTTILKMVYYAERPDSGDITVNKFELSRIRASKVPALRRNVGVVFQEFRLLANKSVYENVALTLRIKRIPDAHIKEVVHSTLRMVNLRHKSDSSPLALSGGEQQRVVIARAIVGEPVILLADEPTGNLDPVTASGIMKIFREINARGTTILIATHNKGLYIGTGMRVLRLENGSIESVESG